MAEDIERLLGRMKLAQSVPDTSKANNYLQSQATFNERTLTFQQAARQLHEQANTAASLSRGHTSQIDRQLEALTPLIMKTVEIAQLGHVLRNDTAEYIFAHLQSLPGSSSDVQKVLCHFKSDITAIVKTTIDTVELVSRAFLLRTLEQCHREASRTDGALHTVHYFDYVHAEILDSPYDPDFESEAYYEYEDRLAIDEDFAEAESLRRQHEYEARVQRAKSTQHAWVGFWVQALKVCPDGLTLFWPSTYVGEQPLPDPPRYLFRTFDADSTGMSNETVVASSASVTVGSKDYNRDLLSLDRTTGCKMLCDHLKKPCFRSYYESDKVDDNLVSWSSSLLFVIQYAIWRSKQKHGRTPDKIKICVVDTEQFPNGQFARDLWLVQKFGDMANKYANLQNIINLREMGYDNGEWLSQGNLIHKGRSCVVSLGALIESGLHELYPDFVDPSGNSRWTNRVRELRQKWSMLGLSSVEDVETAADIARECFHEVGSFELAIMLLTLRERKLRRSTDGITGSILESGFTEPGEVQRYYRVSKAAKSQGVTQLEQLDSFFALKVGRQVE